MEKKLLPHCFWWICFLLECLGCNPVSAVTSTGLPHCSASICGSNSYVSPTPNSIRDMTSFRTSCHSLCHAVICNSALLHSHQGGFSSWWWWWVAPPCPPIGALLSSPSSQASRLVSQLAGKALPEQHGWATPRCVQSLQLPLPGIENCSNAGGLPGRFASKIQKALLMS